MLSKNGEGIVHRPLDRFFLQKKQLIETKDKIDFVQIDFWLQAIVHPEIAPKMENFFKVWREEIEADVKQLDKQHKNSSILASLVISLLMGASLQYLIDEDAFDLDEYFKHAQIMIEDYIRNSK